jgi:hypothetical protein
MRIELRDEPMNQWPVWLCHGACPDASVSRFEVHDALEDGPGKAACLAERRGSSCAKRTRHAALSARVRVGVACWGLVKAWSYRVLLCVPLRSTALNGLRQPLANAPS